MRIEDCRKFLSQLWQAPLLTKSLLRLQKFIENLTVCFLQYEICWLEKYRQELCA